MPPTSPTVLCPASHAQGVVIAQVFVTFKWARTDLRYSCVAMDTTAPPPRSPQLNGHVERAQRGHAEESYEVIGSSFEMLGPNQALLQWGEVNNPTRPTNHWDMSTHSSLSNPIGETAKRGHVIV